MSFLQQLNTHLQKTYGSCKTVQWDVLPDGGGFRANFTILATGQKFCSQESAPSKQAARNLLAKAYLASIGTAAGAADLQPGGKPTGKPAEATKEEFQSASFELAAAYFELAAKDGTSRKRSTTTGGLFVDDADDGPLAASRAKRQSSGSALAPNSALAPEASPPGASSPEKSSPEKSLEKSPPPPPPQVPDRELLRSASHALGFERTAGNFRQLLVETVQRHYSPIAGCKVCSASYDSATPPFVCTYQLAATAANSAAVRSGTIDELTVAESGLPCRSKADAAESAAKQMVATLLERLAAGPRETTAVSSPRSSGRSLESLRSGFLAEVMNIATRRKSEMRPGGEAQLKRCFEGYVKAYDFGSSWGLLVPGLENRQMLLLPDEEDAKNEEEIVDLLAAKWCNMFLFS